MRHLSVNWRVAALLLAAVASPVMGAHTYYVATTGNDTSGNGSQAAPYASISKVLGLSSSLFSAGDTIFVGGGTYNLSSTLTISSSKVGTAAAPYSLLAMPGQTPVLDFAAQTGSARGVVLDGSYWRVQGLTIQNAHDNGILITGSNNTIDRLTLHHNQDSGLQLSGSGSRTPANNLILNTDSYANYDPATNGENADGFAAKFRELGPGNVFRGDRAWGNSDDGWDFWAAANGVTVEKSWSFRNGFNNFGDTSFDGDGNGFKLGHDSGNHVLQNVAAWGNRLNGIDVNGNATVDTSVSTPYVAINHNGVTIKNVTAYKNGFNADGSSTGSSNYNFDESFAHLLQNNISLAGAKADVFNNGVVTNHNSWNSGFSASAGDFLLLDDALLTGPRQADGSLPNTTFLHLSPTSALVNAGANVGLPYNGSAPDLGAFEVPEPSTFALGAPILWWMLGRRRREG